MNIVNKLTIRSLRQNKRRTLVTIIGVVISVAMITGVATLAVSFLELMKKQTITNEGEWHVGYANVNGSQLEAIKKDNNIRSIVLTREAGYAALEGSDNPNKPYLFIKEFNETGFERFPIQLAEGRLPQAANEVVISKEMAKTAKVDYKIGDKLALDVGYRSGKPKEDGLEVRYDQSTPLERTEAGVVEQLVPVQKATYTIVGTIERPEWEPTWAPGYTIISYLDENTINDQSTAIAYVALKKVGKSLYADAAQLANEMGLKKDSVSFHNSLLRYYGVSNNENLRNMMYYLAGIIMTVIIVGSVSLIYNAFAISVSERSRYLGMLASVGATKRQKRNSVFFEGVIIGAISIPIGFVCGLLGIGITFKFINSTIQSALGLTETLSVVVTPLTVATACAVSILTIFISTYIPARRASRISAIDAIRQSTDIKLTGKAVRTSSLIRKLFGMEAEIGLKNLKRNKRKYQATVFSLVISIVLFLSVGYFTDNLKKSLGLSQDGVNFDIRVMLESGNPEKNADMIAAVASMQTVEKYSVMKSIDLQAWVNEANVSDEIKKRALLYDDVLTEGRFNYYISVHALDDHSLEAYAKQVGADWKRLADPDHPSAIVIDKIKYEDEAAGKYVETKAIRIAIGDTLDLFSYDYENEKESEATPVKVAALTDQHPMGVFDAGVGNLNIVVSDRVIHQFIDMKSGDYITPSIYLTSSDPMKTQQDIEEMKRDQVYLYNYYKSRQQEQQMILLMSVFTYGFILLITAISVANIFNTISTSIALRKREFAMLKSIGMTPKGFNKMINYESVFYGMKALLYGLPISVLVMYLVHRSLMNSFSYPFELSWFNIGTVIVAVFIIVTVAMLYSSSKVKKENIIDALKQENI